MKLNQFKPKPIHKQTLVITDCSRGTGLAIARLAAKKGANVVMVGPESEELNLHVDAINASGGRALLVIADVSDPYDAQKIREKALEAFGQVDTWINNSSTLVKRSLSEGELEEERRIFEVNFWGARIGSRVAVECMERNGGVLINVGGEISSAGRPHLGIYQASKHALKAFTDCLRNELREKHVPVEVCVVRPSGSEDVEDLARAIIRCAEHPSRDFYVGGPARLSAVLETFFPDINDMVAMARSTESRRERGQGHPVIKKLEHAMRDVTQKMKVKQPRKQT